MPILTIILVLIVAGVIMYLINRYIPMDSTIKSILNIVVVILIIIWLLKQFGIWGDICAGTLKTRELKCRKRLMKFNPR